MISGGNSKSGKLRFAQARLLGGCIAAFTLIALCSLNCKMASFAQNGNKHHVMPKARLATGELARLLNLSETEVQKWTSCYRAFREFNLRTGQWQSLFKEINPDSKFDHKFFQEIKFSLPEEKDFLSDPDHQFFNSEGMFGAVPIPQDIIDDLTTTKNTRILFNVRRWPGYSSSHSDDKFYHPPEASLVAILPQLKSKCATRVNGMNAWGDRLFKNEKFIVASDHRNIVEEAYPMTEWQYDPNSKQLFYVTRLTFDRLY